MKNCDEMVNSLLERREHYVAEQRRKRKMLTRTVTSMSCVCLVAIMSIGIWQGDLFSIAPPVSLGDSNVIDDKDYTLSDNSSDKSNENQTQQEGLNNQETLSNGQENSDVIYNTDEDAPVDENNYIEQPDSASTTFEGAYADFEQLYGGSYIDSNGQYVVFIIHDSENVRQAVCTKLGLQASDVTFKIAEYSLVYLEEVQEKISTAMANRETPFVISSALREDINRIVVTVTTNDEAELAKLNDFDRIGGVIEIEYTSENVGAFLE